MALVLFYHQTDISIHALREEGDEYLGGYRMPINVFLSTPSARRATYTAWGMKCLPAIFLSTPSARRATGPPRTGPAQGNEFLSTPSARRATTRRPTAPGRPSDFYPRPPRGGRLKSTTYRTMETLISIHALREEGDVGKFIGQQFGQISIHALREEGDPCYHVTVYSPEIISIHALREEGDGQHQQRPYSPCHFYPRPPRGGRHHQ